MIEIVVMAQIYTRRLCHSTIYEHLRLLVAAQWQQACTSVPRQKALHSGCALLAERCLALSFGFDVCTRECATAR